MIAFRGSAATTLGIAWGALSIRKKVATKGSHNPPPVGDAVGVIDRSRKMPAWT
jgi:hypothetical protein